MPHRSYKKKKTDVNVSQQPTMGSLATAFAAHFVTWVEKNEDIREVFERFTRLYNEPEEALHRPIMSPVTSRGPPPMEEVPGDIPVTPGSTGSTAKHTLEEKQAWPPNSLAGSEGSVPARPGPPAQSSPWQPSQFSCSSRQFLLEGIGCRCASFVEIATRIRSPANAATVAAERQEGQALPNLADFQSTLEYMSNPGLHVATADRYTAWVAAGLLLHYERLLARTGPSTEAKGNAKGIEQGTCDPIRPELQCTGLELNAALKAFANADLRERREAKRLAIKVLLPKEVAKPSEPNADVLDPMQSAAAASPDNIGEAEGL